MVFKKKGITTDLDDRYSVPDWLRQRAAASGGQEVEEEFVGPPEPMLTEREPEVPEDYEKDPGIQELQREVAGAGMYDSIPEKLDFIKGNLKLESGLETDSTTNPNDRSWPIGKREHFVENLKRYAELYKKNPAEGTGEDAEKRALEVAIQQVVERTEGNFFDGKFPVFNTSSGGFNKKAAGAIWDRIHTFKGNMNDLKNQSILLNDKENDDYQATLDSFKTGISGVGAKGHGNSGVRLYIHNLELDKLKWYFSPKNPNRNNDRRPIGHAAGRGVDMNWFSKIVDGKVVKFEAHDFRKKFGYKGDPSDHGEFANSMIKTFEAAKKKGKNFMLVNESIPYPEDKKTSVKGNNHIHGNMLTDKEWLKRKGMTVRWGKKGRFVSLGVNPEVFFNTITEADIPYVAYLANNFPGIKAHVKKFLLNQDAWKTRTYYSDPNTNAKTRKKDTDPVSGTDLYNRFLARPFQVKNKEGGWTTIGTIKGKLEELIPDLYSKDLSLPREVERMSDPSVVQSIDPRRG